MKRYFWGYGEPLLFIGLTMSIAPEIFRCVVHSGTSEWNTLEQIFANYTHHLDTYFNNLHAYEEMFEYMSTYMDTQSDGMIFLPIIPKKTNNIQFSFCGIHPTTVFYLLTRMIGRHQVTPLDCLATLLVNKDLVISI